MAAIQKRLRNYYIMWRHQTYSGYNELREKIFFRYVVVELIIVFNGVA